MRKLTLIFLICTACLDSTNGQFFDDFDRENGGVGAGDIESLQNFTITQGFVDLIGKGLVDLYPGNGLYLDLSGSSQASGTIETNLEFEAGYYELSFLLGNNDFGGGENFMTVVLSDFTETFSRTEVGESFESINRIVSVTDASRLRFETPLSDSDGGGIVIDAVSVTPIILGDTNCDGSINLFDVAPFVESLSSGEYSAKADMNLDQMVNLLDVAPFVDLLSGR